MLLPSTAFSAEECNSSVTPTGGGDNTGGETPPTGGVDNTGGEIPPTGSTGSGGQDTLATEGGVLRATESFFSETQYSDPCGATVGESSGMQAQEFAMTLLTKINDSRANRDKGVKGKKKALGGAAGADNAMLDGSRFSLFGFTDYSNRDRHATSRSGGYEQRVNSVTLGFDYRLDDSTFFGASISGSDGDSELDTGDGGSDVSSTTLGIHGAKYWGNTFVAGLIAYGSLDIDVNRTTPVDGFRASTDGGYWYGDLSIGFEGNYGGWRVTPQARVLLLNGDVDAYQEQSASGFGVVRSVNSQDIDSAILALSLQADHPVLMNWGVLLPSVRVELISDGSDGYKSNGQNLNDSDKSAISSFADQADDPDSSTVAVSVGTSAQFSQGLAAYVVYERLFYHDYLTKFTATIGVRYELP
ncbi:autotransporter outer membrane beta-barrel domain-containing protein [Zhongshania arctica]|uniref:Autotransporter outer membrane beta-barrel domain-containing protein n=1 Tax=Zhongshania arctica TaxID=3238302 RepID=A0ABV3TXL9_9GAMM